MSVVQLASRRTRATLKLIEDTIKAGMNNDLTVTSVSHYPDGRSVVHFGDTTRATVKDQQTGWEDV